MEFHSLGNLVSAAMVSLKVLVALALVLIVSALPSHHHQETHRRHITIDHGSPTHNERSYRRSDDGERGSHLSNINVNVDHRHGHRGRHQRGKIGVIRHGPRSHARLSLYSTRGRRTTLRDCGFFYRKLNRSRTGRAYEYMRKISSTRGRANNHNEMFNTLFSTMGANAGILNGYLKGYGDIYLRSHLVFHVAACCSNEFPRIMPNMHKAYGRPGFCKNNKILSQYGLSDYKGSYSNAKQLVEYYKTNRQLERIQSYKIQSNQGIRGAIHKCMIESAKISSKSVTRWTREDAIRMITLNVKMMSLIFQGYGGNKGLVVVRGFQHHFSKMEQKLHFSIDYKSISQEVTQCRQDSLNGAIGQGNFRRTFRTHKQYKGLRGFRQFRYCFRSRRCGVARKMMTELSQYETSASSIDEAIEIVIKFVRANRNVLDIWYRGLGYLYERIVIAFIRYNACSKNGLVTKIIKERGLSRAKVCNNNYGAQYKWKAYRGSYDKWSDIISFYKLHGVEKQIIKYKNRHNKGKEVDHPTARAIFSSLSVCAALIGKDTYTRKDIGNGFVHVTTIGATIFRGYHEELADYYIESWLKHFTVVGKFFGEDIFKYKTQIQKNIKDCQRYNFNGAINLHKTSDTIVGKNNGHDDDDNNLSTGSTEVEEEENENDNEEVDRNASSNNGSRTVNSNGSEDSEDDDFTTDDDDNNDDYTSDGTQKNIENEEDKTTDSRKVEDKTKDKKTSTNTDSTDANTHEIRNREDTETDTEQKESKNSESREEDDASGDAEDDDDDDDDAGNDDVDNTRREEQITETEESESSNQDINEKTYESDSKQAKYTDETKEVTIDKKKTCQNGKKLTQGRKYRNEEDTNQDGRRYYDEEKDKNNKNVDSQNNDWNGETDRGEDYSDNEYKGYKQNGKGEETGGKKREKPKQKDNEGDNYQGDNNKRGKKRNQSDQNNYDDSDKENTDDSNVEEIRNKRRTTNEKIKSTSTKHDVRGGTLNNDIMRKYYNVFKQTEVRQKFVSISQTYTKQASNMDDIYDVMMRSTDAYSIFLDRYMSGMGTYFRKAMYSMALNTACTSNGVIYKRSKGLKICSTNYGDDWGWTAYDGEYKASSINEYYKVKTLYSNAVKIAKPRPKHGTAKTVINNALDILKIVSKASYSYQDVANVLQKFITILGATGSGHHPRMGKQVTSAWYSYYDYFYKFMKYDYKKDQSKTNKEVSKCTKYQFNKQLAASDQNDSQSESDNNESYNTDGDRGSGASGYDDVDDTNDNSGSEGSNGGRKNRNDRKADKRNEGESRGSKGSESNSNASASSSSSSSRDGRNTYSSSSSAASANSEGGGRSASAASSASSASISGGGGGASHNTDGDSGSGASGDDDVDNTNDNSGSEGSNGGQTYGNDRKANKRNNRKSRDSKGSKDDSNASAASRSSSSRDGRNTASSGSSAASTSSGGGGRSASAASSASSDSISGGDGGASSSAATATSSSGSGNGGSAASSGSYASSASGDGQSTSGGVASTAISDTSGSDMSDNHGKSEDGSENEASYDNHQGRSKNSKTSIKQTKAASAYNRQQGSSAGQQESTISNQDGRHRSEQTQISKRDMTHDSGYAQQSSTNVQDDKGSRSNQQWSQGKSSGSASELHQNNEQIEQNPDGSFKKSQYNSDQQQSASSNQSQGGSETEIHDSNGSVTQRKSSYSTNKEQSFTSSQSSSMVTSSDTQ